MLKFATLLKTAGLQQYLTVYLLNDETIYAGVSIFAIKKKKKKKKKGTFKPFT